MTPSEQARADAMADAETLEEAIGVSPIPMTEGEWQTYLEEQR